MCSVHTTLALWKNTVSCLYDLEESFSYCVLPSAYFNLSSFPIPPKLFFPNSSMNIELFISYSTHFIPPVSPVSVNVTNIYTVAQVKNLKLFHCSFLFLIALPSIHQKVLFAQIPKHIPSRPTFLHFLCIPAQLWSSFIKSPASHFPFASTLIHHTIWKKHE